MLSCKSWRRPSRSPNLGVEGAGRTFTQTHLHPGPKSYCYEVQEDNLQLRMMWSRVSNGMSCYRLLTGILATSRAFGAYPRGSLYYLGAMDRIEPKKVVEEGYDRIGERYAQDLGMTRQELRSRQVSYLMTALPCGSALLDLGCGAGTPTTKRLAEHFTVTGVDISQRQVERARRDVPEATFIRADMTSLRLPRCSFDAVTAFFSIIHVPRDEQPDLLRSIAAWLRPKGLLFATMTARGKEIDFDKCWMGAPMFWSGHDSDTNKRIVREAGLDIVSDRRDPGLGRTLPLAHGPQ